MHKHIYLIQFKARNEIKTPKEKACHITTAVSWQGIFPQLQQSICSLRFFSQTEKRQAFSGQTLSIPRQQQHQCPSKCKYGIFLRIRWDKASHIKIKEYKRSIGIMLKAQSSLTQWKPPKSRRVSSSVTDADAENDRDADCWWRVGGLVEVGRIVCMSWPPRDSKTQSWVEHTSLWLSASRSGSQWHAGLQAVCGVSGLFWWTGLPSSESIASGGDPVSVSGLFSTPVETPWTFLLSSLRSICNARQSFSSRCTFTCRLSNSLSRSVFYSGQQRENI